MAGTITLPMTATNKSQQSAGQLDIVPQPIEPSNRVSHAPHEERFHLESGSIGLEFSLRSLSPPHGELNGGVKCLAQQRDIT